MNKFLSVFLFNSRWILAPMYLGLIGGLLVLLFKFFQEFIHIVVNIFALTEREAFLSILALVDITLIANLLIIVVFSGYENFVSKINVDDHKEKPDWMGKVDYSGLKIKLIGSIVAISAIDLLKAFMHISTPGGAGQLNNSELSWMVGIHMSLIISGVMFAWMDKIAESIHDKK